MKQLGESPSPEPPVPITELHARGRVIRGLFASPDPRPSADALLPRRLHCRPSGHLLGLYLCEKEHGGDFTETDTHLTEFYAGALGLAFANAQLFSQLREARDLAIESVRLKSEFLTTVSHEIRTPMNGIVGMTRLLLLETDLTADQREFAEVINKSASALLAIINDILNFSKIEFDLQTTVEEICVLLAEQAHRKGIELACLIHTAVPAIVRGDSGRLRQILMNLIGNAIKFTEQGEILVRVETVKSEHDIPPVTSGSAGSADLDGLDGATRRSTACWLRFSVSDTGIGIISETRACLFKPFVQGDGSTTRKYGGTGLGLAICKQLVALMEGTIGVSSEPDNGTTFWFTLPLEIQSPAPPAPVAPEGLQGRRALIVDDSAANRRILEEHLPAWGMTFASVAHGQEALAQLRLAEAGNTPFDMVLLDLQMPDIDGLELARMIKADPLFASTPLVLLSSYGWRGQARAAQEAGLSAYLPNPIRQKELYECLMIILSQPGQTGTSAPPQAIARLVCPSEHQRHRSWNTERNDGQNFRAVLHDEGAQRHRPWFSHGGPTCQKHERIYHGDQRTWQGNHLRPVLPPNRPCGRKRNHE